VYNAKEQAKIYLDQIKTTVKAGGSTLLILVPVLVLLFIEIQKSIGPVHQFLTIKENAIRDRENRLLAVRNKKLISDSIYALASGSSVERDSEKTKSIVKGLYKRREVQYENARGFDRAILVKNDSLEAKIRVLKFALEIPIVKKTVNLTIQNAVLVVLLIMTGTLIYILNQRFKLAKLIYQFFTVCSENSLSVSPNHFKDLQITLPLWKYPFPDKPFSSCPDISLSELTGVPTKRIAFYNRILLFIWIGIFVLASFLAYLNWEINYKIFHTHYSWLVAVGFLLIAVNVFLTYYLVRPIFGYNNKTKDEDRTRPVMSRAGFVGLSLAAVGALLVEPVHGALTKGNKWFHVPRFVRKNLKAFKRLKPGFYTNRSAHRIGAKVLNYIGSMNNLLLKSVPDVAPFEKNLSVVTDISIAQTTTLLNHLSEKDLLILISRLKGQDQQRALSTMNTWIEQQDAPVSLGPRFIDLYSSLYSSTKRGSVTVTKDANVLRHIAEFRLSPILLLPPKYQDENANEGQWKKEVFNRMKQTLLQQSEVRMRRWETRLQ